MSQEKSPPSSKPSGAMLPAVIPQTTTSWKGAFYCPFARAYPPELKQHGISEADFLRFLDGFNEAFVASPVFEATNMAGMVMGWVYGVQPVQWAGVGLQAASGLGSAAVSYVRARSYVKAANRKLFFPRGLAATVLTTKKLTDRVGYPDQKVQLLPVDQAGLEETGDDDDAAVPGRPGAKVLARRIDALQGYVQPLSFDVPPSASSTNLYKRMGEWNAERRAKRQERRLAKRRNKADRVARKREAKRKRNEKRLETLNKELETCQITRDHQLASESAQEDPRVRKRIEKEYAKSAGKIEKRCAKRERIAEKGGRKDERRHEKLNKRENRAVNKVRWIVIHELDGTQQEDEVEDEENLEHEKLRSDESSLSDTETDSGFDSDSTL